MGADEIQGAEIRLHKVRLLDPDIEPVLQLDNKLDKSQGIQLRLKMFRIPDPLLFQNFYNRAFHGFHGTRYLLVRMGGSCSARVDQWSLWFQLFMVWVCGQPHPLGPRPLSE